MNYPVAITANAVLVALLAGLIQRKRYSLSLVFVAYVIAVLASDVLMLSWPRVFYQLWFYIAKQGVINALKLGFVLEIAFRTFRVFPGARRSASVVVALILGLGSVSLLGTSWVLSGHASLGSFEPRVGHAVLWTIVATLALARFYNVPVHPFHRNLLLVLGLYQTFFGGLFSYFSTTPLAIILEFVNKVGPVAYLLTVSWWLYFVWQPETAAMRDHTELVKRVEERAWA